MKNKYVEEHPFVELGGHPTGEKKAAVHLQPYLRGVNNAINLLKVVE